MPGYEVISKEELLEVQDVFSKGGILFRNGFDSARNSCYKVKEFEDAFAKRIGSKYALAVSSGTAALRVSLAALKIGLGDEVITQSFTFVATAEAIIESGATPVCTDIDDTLNMCPLDLERRITSATKAVIVVHMLGTPARLEQIKLICKKHNLFLIEDTAWGCGGALKNQSLGTWGDIGTFSFDFAKTITTGEGGMIVCNDQEIFKNASAWHDHGHENNPTVPRWEDTRSGSGFNYRMMELQGAIGIAQTRKLSFVIESQRRNSLKIWNLIKDLPGIEPRKVIEGSFETADALVFLVPNKSMARSCRGELLKEGFSTKILPEAYSWHFAGTWNHMPKLVKKHGPDLMNEFKSSDSLLSRAIALPIGIELNLETPFLISSILSKVLK